jgi:hypothetical protein
MDMDTTVQTFKELIDPEVLSLLSDACCRRFLRARSMDINKAVEMANSWGKWYTSPAECGTTTPMAVLDNIVDRNEDIYTRICPLSHMGEDLEGSPIYWEQSGDISQRFGDLADLISLDDMVTRHIRNQELAMCRLHHLSLKHNRPIEKQVIVFNLKDLSYSLDTRSLSVFRRIINIDQDFYPERLKKFFVINCPW